MRGAPARGPEMRRCTSEAGAKGPFLPPLPVSSSGVGWEELRPPVPWGGQSLSPRIQMLIPSGSTPTDTPRSDVEPGGPRPVELTRKTSHHELPLGTKGLLCQAPAAWAGKSEGSVPSPESSGPGEGSPCAASVAQRAGEETGHRRLHSEVSSTLTRARALLLKVWELLRRADPDLPVNQPRKVRRGLVCTSLRRSGPEHTGAVRGDVQSSEWKFE